MDELETVEQMRDRQRESYLKRLVELAGRDRPQSDAKYYRAEATKTIMELAKLDQIAAPTAGKLSQVRNANVAIAKFLEEVNAPCTRQEVIDGVRQRGFLNGVSDLSVGNCINNYTNGTGSKSAKAKIKVVGDKIGLRGWPDEIFYA